MTTGSQRQISGKERKNRPRQGIPEPEAPATFVELKGGLVQVSGELVVVEAAPALCDVVQEPPFQRAGEVGLDVRVGGHGRSLGGAR